MSGRLAGQRALVTGGSRGLGRAIAVALAAEGAFVAFNYRSRAADAAETERLAAEAGGRARGFQVDVLDYPGLVGLCRTVESEEGGPFTILVNNAGVGQVVPLALMEEADWDRMMDTHVKGAFLATKAALRGMIRQKYGRILNIGSLAGTKMMEAPVHYATAKAALRGFTEAVAKEVGRYGITVNNLAPGLLTDGVMVNLPEGRKAEFLRHCSLGRLGEFHEVAVVAAFLVSPENSYMNGATVLVDGAV